MGYMLIPLKTFVKKRGSKHPNDAVQNTIKSLLESGPKRAAASEAARNPGGVGDVVGSSLYLHDVVTYYYCGIDGCVQKGQLPVQFNMTIQGKLDFGLYGSLGKYLGHEPIKFSKVECLTYYDGSVIDIAVHAWQNCTEAQGSSYQAYKDTLGGSWSGGTKGEKYHPQYNIVFNHWTSDEFSVQWTGKEYWIQDSGITQWLAP